MKKIISCFAVLALVLSFGLANAGELRVPQQFQQDFEAATGSTAKLVNAIWFPIVPELAQFKWDNILIVSNFNNFTITVACWFTTFSQSQTIKTYTLDFYEKLILQLDVSGFGDELYDIYCASDQVFGAAVLLLEGGSIATAWPPIY